MPLERCEHFKSEVCSFSRALLEYCSQSLMHAIAGPLHTTWTQSAIEVQSYWDWLTEFFLRKTLTVNKAAIDYSRQVPFKKTQIFSTPGLRVACTSKTPILLQFASLAHQLFIPCLDTTLGISIDISYS